MDRTSPNVTLNYPINQYNTSSTSITFNCTATDNINLRNVTLYLWNSTGGLYYNTTNSTPNNNTPVIFTKDVAPNTNYTWNCWACDNSSNCAFASANWVFTVNISVSWNQTTLNLGSGYKGAGSLNGSANIVSNGSNTNVTVRCASGNCSIITSNWINGTNMTDGQSNITNFTCSDSTIGSFWAVFNVTSNNDTAPNSINVSCQILTPVVSWNQTTLNLGWGPLNGGNLTGYAKILSLGNNTNVTVNCSSGNCTLASLIIVSNWTVVNMTHNQNSTVKFTCVNSSEGSFWAVFNVTSAEDTTPYQINVSCEITPPDLTPPVVSFTSPTDANGSAVGRNWTFVNVTTDEVAENCSLEWSGVNETMYGSGMNWYVNKTSADGTYGYKVYYSDFASNWNYTETRTITLDTTPPFYSSVSDDSGGTVLEGTIVNVSAYWPDTLSNLSTAEFYHNASGSFVLISTCDLSGAQEGWCNTTIDTTGMADLTVCWKQYANDSAGNENDTMPDSDNCFDVVTRPILTVTKTIGLVDDVDAEPGDYLNFTIIMENAGTRPVYNVTLFDYLPPEFNYTRSWLVNSSGSYPIGEGNVTQDGNTTAGLNLTWNMSWYSNATIAVGSNFTIITEVRVMSNASAGVNMNSACANGTNLIGTSTGQVCDYANVWVYFPQLLVTKTGNATDAKPGDTVSYLVTIYNPTSAMAYNVTISDILQYGFELSGNATLTIWDGTHVNVSAIDPDNETIIWDYTVNLPSLKTITLTYNTTVTSDAKCGMNIVTINYLDGYGVQMTPVQDIWKLCPIRRGILTLDKIALTSLIHPGNDVSYEIIVTNTGDGTLSDITLNDTLPAGWTYISEPYDVSAECGGGVDNTSITGNSMSFNVSSIAVGGTCRFKYNASTPELTCFGEYYNEVNATSYDTNGTLINDSSYASVDVIPEVVLGVSKSISGGLFYNYSNVITFIINVTSEGNTTAYNVTLNDTLPVGLNLINVTNESGSLVSSDATGTPASGQSVNFSAGNVTGNSYKVFYVNANATESTFEGMNLNKITVSGEGPCGETYTDSDFISFVVGIPKLYVYKSQEKASIQPGEQNKYNITITNTGTGTAYNVNITDTLTRLTYVAGSSQLNGVPVGEPVNLSNKLMWNSTTLNNTNLTRGASISLTFNLTANLSSGCGVDMAMDEAYANASDGAVNIISNTYSVPTQVIHPFIEVTKYANVTRAEAGDLIQYVITVRNPSMATAYNVTVIDVLQEGFVNQSGGNPAPSGYNDTTRTLTWASFNLSGNNATTIISYAAMVTPNATAPPGVNMVTASAVDGGGCALVNATDAWGVIVFNPAVQVRKNVNISVAQPGDVLEYEISVYNPSEAKAYNVSVYEFNQTGFYPAGWTASVYELNRAGFREWLKYIGTVNIYNATVNVSGDNVSALSFNLSNITSSTQGVIVNGTLYPYAGITIKFNMTAGKDAATGYDEAWALGYYYGGTTRASLDFDREYVIINHPYLDIEKSTIPETLGTAKPGDTVTYRIRIINPDSGPVASMADAVIQSVMDEMQDGYVLTSNGTGTAAGVSCNLIANSTTGLIKFTPESPVILSPGQELIFNFTARVNSSADFEGCNIASYNATDKANGTILTRYSQKCLTVLKPKANINKISDRQASEPGGIVEFTLMLENDGNSPLYNVTINDTLTSGWEFIETTQNVTGMTINETSTGSATNNTVIFSGITLNEGQRSIIKYTSMITDDVPEGSSENCANVTGYDNGSTPYSDGYCMEITVYKPSLEVVKDVSQHDIEPGSEPMVTLIIQNPTYATVYNITVKEFLPRGFNYTAGSAKLDGVPVDDPNITGIETFDCGSTTTGQLNLTWNRTYAGALSEIPPKTIRVLTFKTHVKCNVQNNVFNNTVNVSGVNGDGGAVGPNGTFFEMRGYLADAELYKYESNNAPTYFEYVDYKIVIWNNPAGANIAPLTLADVMPPYLKYVPGYTYVGDLKLEPAVCGDYTDREAASGPITNVRNDSGGVNCSGFNGTLMDAAGTKFNATETKGDGKGQILLWNLSKWLFLTPGQQVSIRYRTQVIPGIGRIAQNNATLSYLDPEHPELCSDCIFDLSISRIIAVNPPAGWTDTKDVNYTLKLKKGWNLISLPVTPENTTLASVMSPIEGKYLDVAAWDGWWVYRSYAYGDWFGTLDLIEPKKGYWINMKEDADLLIRGQSTNAFNITLHGGWNLIGWPSTQAMPVENLTLAYVDLATWDGVWIYRSYAYGDWFGDLSSIEPGKGYWLNIAGTSKLSVG